MSGLLTWVPQVLSFHEVTCLSLSFSLSQQRRQSVCGWVAMLAEKGLISCCCRSRGWGCLCELDWKQALQCHLKRWRSKKIFSATVLNPVWIFLPRPPSCFSLTSSSPLRSHPQVWWWHLQFWWTREEFVGFILSVPAEPLRFLRRRTAVCGVFV